MTRKNKTRSGAIAQKKGTCTAVIPYVEADILGDGSVFVNMPKRSVVTKIYNLVILHSDTPNSTLDILTQGFLIADETLVTARGVIEVTIFSISQYLEKGGELIIRAGTVSPATGSLVGELIVEYTELDRNIGEYTTFLDN